MTTSNSPRQKLDQDHPKGEATFEMARLVQITGRMIDDATGEPIKGVQAVLRNPRASDIDLMLTSVAEAAAARGIQAPGLTDDRGVFQLTARPGLYIVGMISAPMTKGIAYSPETAAVVDSNYEDVYWPGGVPLSDVRPMELASGAFMNMGDLHLKKVQRYRVRVIIPQGDCPEGESVRLVTAQRSVPQTRSAGVHRCGSDIMLQGFEPGSYAIYAVSDWQGERDNVGLTVWGQSEFSITKENAEVTVDLHHGAVLDGQLKAAEGSVKLPERIPILARPRDALFGTDVGREEFIEWFEDGRFHMAVGPGRQKLEAVVGNNTAYVSEMVFDGAPVSEMTLDAKPGAKQRLEIVLDNRFGTIEGTVEGPISSVRLVRNNEVLVGSVPVINGTFRTLMPPGEYRVVDANVPPERMASISEKVVVKTGETATVKVRAQQR